MKSATISPRELYDAVRAGASVELLDVRTPVEYEDSHVDFATNVPLNRIDPAEIASRRAGSREPLYVMCQSGARGRQAAEKLIAAGCEEVVNVEGGLRAWGQTGLPLVRGQRAVVSIERQVRIAAGSLVLLGAILGFFVHPYWIALAAFVGAGLVFAGITDTCGMGLLLLKAPWNQSVNSTPTVDAGAGKACAR